MHQKTYEIKLEFGTLFCIVCYTNLKLEFLHALQINLLHMTILQISVVWICNTVHIVSYMPPCASDFIQRHKEVSFSRFL